TFVYSGGLWATAVGASVAYGRRKTPQMRADPRQASRAGPHPRRPRWSRPCAPLLQPIIQHQQQQQLGLRLLLAAAAGHHRRRPGEREVELVVLPFLPAARCRQMKMMTITMIN
ncbi:hypothetical protein EE612_053156, partial [Oryza sativa]